MSCIHSVNVLSIYTYFLGHHYRQWCKSTSTNPRCNFGCLPFTCKNHLVRNCANGMQKTSVGKSLSEYALSIYRKTGSVKNKL